MRETIESAERESQSAWVTGRPGRTASPASFAQLGASTGTPGSRDGVSATGAVVGGAGGGVGTGTWEGTAMPATGSTAPHPTEARRSVRGRFGARRSRGTTL